MFKRKSDNLWQEIVREWNGKKLPKPKYFYGRTQAEVKRKISEYKDNLVTGEAFSTVARLWWEEAEPKLAYNSVKPYKPALERAIQAFGDCYIRDITPQEINKEIREFAKTHADRTVRTQLMVYNLIFKFAVAEGFATFNASRDLKIPAGLSKKKVHVPSSEDIQRVKDSTSCPFGMFAFMAMYTGMRKGELLALEWKDIDMEHRTITISKSLYHKSGVPTVKTPKTAASVAQVPIPDALYKKIKKKKCGLVFPNSSGGYMTEWDFKKSWGRYCKDTGVTANPHQFRHCYATMLVENNIPPEKAQLLVRHAQLSTTMDVYREIRESERKKIFEETYSIDIK